MTIDAHAHWRPPALIEALRERRQKPHIRENNSGVDVLLDGTREIPITEAFDDIDNDMLEDELYMYEKLLEMADHLET